MNVRDVWVVASFEFLESLRSRKALGLLLLALIGALAGTAIFLNALHAMEVELAVNLGVKPTAGTGGMATEVLHSKQFVSGLGEMLGDKALAQSLANIPPLALFLGWFGLTFIPLLVILSSCDAVSGEMSTGSARFALFRVDRLSWLLGKFGGQAALMTLGIALAGAAAYLEGMIFMTRFPAALTAVWMFRLGARVWIYGFAYLGLALGASQLSRSVNLTRVFGLLALFAMGVIPRVMSHYEEHAPLLLGQLRLVFPQAHVVDLWEPNTLDQLPSLVMLVALGTLYFGVGYAYFSRVDR